MLISVIVETCNGSKKRAPKYWVSMVKLAKILYDISGVLGTLISKNISFVNFWYFTISIKVAQWRMVCVVTRGVDEGSSHHGSKNNEP